MNYIRQLIDLKTKKDWITLQKFINYEIIKLMFYIIKYFRNII